MMGTQFHYHSLIKNLAAANISANSEATNYPVEYVQTRWAAQTWHSNGDANEFILADLGSAQNFNGVFLKTHNLTANAMVLFQANNTNVWDAPGLNQELTVTDDLIAYVWANNETYQFVRVTFADNDNPDGYIKIGVWWLNGTRFSPTRDFIHEYSYQFVDPSLLNYSDGGQLSTLSNDKYYLRNYSFPKSPDYASWKTMMANVGYTKGLFLVENSANVTTTSYYVRVADYRPEHAYSTYWDIGLQTEDLR